MGAYWNGAASLPSPANETPQLRFMTNIGVNIKEVLEVTNRDDLKETGGGHNQKGVDFQRYWALMRIFQVEESGQNDFLFLFEAIQDVAEFDSSVSPSSVTVYQVKKKDRGEWGWGGLTNLPSPRAKTPKSGKGKKLPEMKISPFGKLYATVIAFSNITSRGHFISNAGCDLPLINGGNAATSVPCSMTSLEPTYQSILQAGLQTLHKAGMPTPDLDRIKIERVALHPDNLVHTLVGQVATFLQKRSPRHSGQAKSLVDSLMATIGPLGARTDKCTTFDEVKERHGFTRNDLTSALGQLECLPDLIEHLDNWLRQLSFDGIDLMTLTAIKAAACAYYSRQVMGSHTKQEEAFVAACDKWLDQNVQTGTLRQFFEKAHSDLSGMHGTLRRPEIFAIFALRAITKCVDQT